MDCCGPILYYEAGQVATIVLESQLENNTYPELYDVNIESVIGPDMRMIKGFPAVMHKLSPNHLGVYVARFKLPTGNSACGTYLCHIKWKNKSGDLRRTLYSIIVKSSSAKEITAVGL